MMCLGIYAALGQDCIVFWAYYINPDDGLVSTMEAFHLFPGFIELDRNVVFLFVCCCVFVVVFVFVFVCFLLLVGLCFRFNPVRSHLIGDASTSTIVMKSVAWGEKPFLQETLHHTTLLC